MEIWIQATVDLTPSTSWSPSPARRSARRWPAIPRNHLQLNNRKPLLQASLSTRPPRLSFRPASKVNNPALSCTILLQRVVAMPFRSSTQPLVSPCLAPLPRSRRPRCSNPFADGRLDPWVLPRRVPRTLCRRGSIPLFRQLFILAGTKRNRPCGRLSRT